MALKKKSKRRKAEAQPVEPCKKMHVDTEEKADTMMALLKKQYPDAKPVKQYDSKCLQWHVGMVR